MASSTDFYAILGVPRDASDDDIKKAYRRLARKFHPDVNKEKGAEEKFKEVSAAFQVLGEPDKRKLYDEFGPEGLRAGFDPEAARAYRRAGGGFGGARPGRGPMAGGEAEGFGGSFDFSDLLNELFRQSRQSAGGPMRAPGSDIESAITVDLKDAANGAQIEIAVERPTPCATCDGEGVAPDARPRTCTTCHGSGRVRMKGPMPINVPCQECRGTGVLEGPPCPTCGGSGETAQRTRLQVGIPRGVEEGSRIRLAGQGGPGVAGGPPGDLYLTVHLRPHPLLKRDGLDLTLDLPVTVREALEGTDVDVPTLGGPVRMKVPAGIQSGQKLRLRGRGMPNLKGALGDLFAVVQIRVPKHADAAALEAARTLEGRYDGDLRAGLTL